MSYGWNIQFQKRRNNAQQYFNYLIRGSLRKLYKYPVKPKYFCISRKYFAFQEGNIFAFQEANFVSAGKPTFSDVGDTNISATMFLTFDNGFSLKKNINLRELTFMIIYSPSC